MKVSTLFLKKQWAKEKIKSKSKLLEMNENGDSTIKFYDSTTTKNGTKKDLYSNQVV